MLGWDSSESTVETVETKRVYIVWPSNLRTLPTYHPCNRFQFKVVWIEEIKGRERSKAVQQKIQTADQTKEETRETLNNKP